MLDLLVHLRLMNMLYHQYHHVSARIAFFSDHEAFGEWYEQLESDYDGVGERLIGLTDSSQLNFHTITEEISKRCKAYPIDGKENRVLFEASLSLETDLKKKLEILIKAPGTSQGTIQLLGDIENLSEMRVYKIKQRIKK